jgi:hypothetical protein
MIRRPYYWETSKNQDVDRTDPPKAPMQLRPCKGCGQPFSASIEKCPHCGKDDVWLSQSAGVMITLVGILLFLPIIALFVVIVLS